MTAITIDTTAADKIRAAIQSGKLKAGSWGDGNESVCMMSALVSGAKGSDACVTAGWPEWLADLNVSLFDAEVGAINEDAARFEFALRVAELVQTPRNYDKARDLFLIRRLDTGDHSALKSFRLNPVGADWWRDCEAAIVRVVALLQKRARGEDVADEMKTARAAASAAAWAVREAASAAAYAAADAASAAASAAAYAAAYAAADAASAAASAAARADLIAALAESEEPTK